MISEKAEVIRKLNQIFINRFAMDFCDMRKVNPTISDERLLSHKVGLMASNLLYVFFDIEREFGITIPQEAIVSGRFDTFNHIVGIIEDCLQSQKQTIITVGERL